MVPLRKSMVARDDARLTFHEGRACAEVLKAGVMTGGGAGKVFSGLGFGAVYVFLVDGLRVRFINYHPIDTENCYPCLWEGIQKVPRAQLFHSTGLIIPSIGSQKSPPRVSKYSSTSAVCLSYLTH